MHAHDHALVHRVTGLDEHAASVIQLAQGVGEDFTGVHADEHAVLAAGNVSLVRLVSIEYVGDQARPTCEVEKLVGKADQAARGNAVLQPHTAAPIGLHVHQLALALAQGLHHATLVLLLHIGGHQFDRLALDAVDLLEHHPWLAHGQLIALAAHVFQQDGQVQLAPPRHLEDAVLTGLAHAKGHVALQLLLQAVPDLAAGDELALSAGQR